MPEFSYTAVSLNGILKNGSRDAESVKRLTELLASEGFELIQAEPRKSRTKKPGLCQKLKTAELANLLFRVGIQLRAGVTIIDALRTREGEENSKAESAIRQQLSEMLEQGTPLSQAFDRFPQVFPSYIRNITKVAEQSGSLDQNFIELRDYLEWMDRNWKAFKQAMLYPTFVVAALIIFIFIALRFVFPTVTELLFELDIPLPLITRIMIAASDFVVNYWVAILSLLVFGPACLRLIFRISKQAALIRDHFLLKLPFLGDVILTLAISRFLRSLILMQKAGVVITDSLAMAREVVGNQVIEKSVARIETAVSNGSTMSSVMSKEPCFPPLVRTMVGVGERSGSLDTSLQAVVDYYDDLVPRKIKTFFAVLEPSLIVLTVIMAGLVAAAVFLPLVNMLSPGAF
jgi:type II secretory pathway component PulF